MTTSLGEIIQTRRQNMGMSLSTLSRQMGGSPGASFLSRIETAQTEPSAQVAIRLADALNVPRDVMLNAAGFATPTQNEEAMRRLGDLIGTPAPIIASLPVRDPEHPNQDPAMLPRRQRMLRAHEDAFLIDFVDPANAPFLGEVLVATERKPQDGQGVVAELEGRLSAWTYRSSKTKGAWLENAAGQKISRNYVVRGVILRVVSELNLEG